jgi:cytochrome c-type biogenesis protein CcmF
MRIGDRVQVAGYEVRLDRVFPRTGPNYREDVGSFAISRNGRDLGTTETMKRLYPARNMPTTEAGIRSFGFSQLYISLGEPQPDGVSIGVKIFWKPLILLIWLGSVVMALGGFWSLTDRRFRVGAPTRAATPVPHQAVPAE